MIEKHTHTHKGLPTAQSSNPYWADGGVVQPFRLSSPAEVTAELLLCAQRSSEGRPGLVSKASPKPVQEGAGEVEVGIGPFLVPKVGKVPKGGTKSELSLTHIPFCCGCHPCVHARVCVCGPRVLLFKGARASHFGKHHPPSPGKPSFFFIRPLAISLVSRAIA